MSIVRVGLAETKKFAEGYDAIFGKKPAEGSGGSGGKSKKPAAKKASNKKKPKKK